MRQMAAAALAALYQPDNISPLSIFTERFKARFAELIYDVDEMVAVQGVNPRPVLPLRPSPCGSPRFNPAVYPISSYPFAALFNTGHLPGDFPLQIPFL